MGLKPLLPNLTSVKFNPDKFYSKKCDRQLQAKKALERHKPTIHLTYLKYSIKRRKMHYLFIGCYKDQMNRINCLYKVIM